MHLDLASCCFLCYFNRVVEGGKASTPITERHEVGARVFLMILGKKSLFLVVLAQKKGSAEALPFVPPIKPLIRRSGEWWAPESQA